MMPYSPPPPPITVRHLSLIGDKVLQRLGQVQLGHGVGVHVAPAAAEQRTSYGLAAQVLQRVRLHPLGRQRFFDLEEHRAEYVVTLRVTEHGAHDVRVHSVRVLAHRLREKRDKFQTRFDVIWFNNYKSGFSCTRRAALSVFSPINCIRFSLEIRYSRNTIGKLRGEDRNMVTENSISE